MENIPTQSDSNNVFLTLTHYSTEGSTSPWYIPNGGNTGIGNMLFQITSSLCFALKHQAKLYVPGLETFFKLENVKKETSIFRNVCSECPPEYLAVKNGAIPMTTEHKNIWEYDFVNNIHFNEYFENYQNLMDQRAMIQELFGPTPQDIEYITRKYPQILDLDLCSIHVRLGPDYKRIFHNNHARLAELQHTYWTCIDHVIKEKGVKTFFVFTNDRQYCQYILDNNPKYQEIKFIYSDERDFIDIWMMSMIKYNIVSLSTLAWWGSFLNKHPDQYVVCHRGCRDDLHYPGWTVL
jgi:hypothetical protein